MERIRRAALPAARSLRSTVAAVLFVLTVSVGLLALHDAAGGEHAGHHPDASAGAVAASAVSSDHAAHASTDRAAHGSGHVGASDSEDADHAPPACSIAGPACAMTAAAPVTPGLAAAPGERPLTSAVVEHGPRGIRLDFVALPPPDLHLLSISRT